MRSIKISIREKGLLHAQEHQEELRLEFNNLKANVVGDENSIGEPQIDELKDQIANKLALGVNKAGDYDWWWQGADGRSEAVLRDVLKILEKARPDTSARYRWIAYIWRIFMQLVYLVIVLCVFSAADTKFETIVIAMLVLTYNAIVGTREGVGLTFFEMNAALREMYGEMGRSLRLKIPVSAERKAKARIDQSGGDLLIKGLPLMVGSLIAIWKIINASSL